MDLERADSNESLLLDNSSLEKPFRFLDLPPEVRNKVYQCPCIYETANLRGRRVGVARRGTFADLRQAPITRVNKQIRNEALPIFYGDHDFVIQLPPLPPDWQSLRPRHKDYQDPIGLVRKKLNAFTPDPNNNLQANSLQFLSNLALEIKIESSRQWRLADLGFIMSSTGREPVFDEDVEDSALMKTAGLDWNRCVQTKEAYLAAVDSCPLLREAHDLLSVSGVCCGEVDQAASALSALMCRIAKLCPHLTKNVSAFIGPSVELIEELLEARALQMWSEEEFGSEGDE